MSSYRPEIIASEYAVSAGHYLAAEAGLEVLNAGGNAIDAGVAAGITLGVVQSDLVNFAGVAPIMIRLAATGEIFTLDGLGTWPRRVDTAVFQQQFEGVIPEGILRVIVPAAPAAWLTALERYGRLSFAEVCANAVRLARDGFGVDRFLAEFVEQNRDGFGRWEANRAIYLPQGRPPEVGSRWAQSDLAATLQYMIDEEAGHRAEGREAGIRAAYDAFYRGDIAGAIADYHRQHGGWLTREDLDAYRISREPTVVGRYAGVEVHCCGPWSQGPALAQALSILDGFGLGALEHNGVAYVHAVSEALNLAFADRERYFGDPKHVKVPLGALLSADYVALRRALIREERAFGDLPPPGDPLAPAARAAAGRDRQSPKPVRSAAADPHETRAGGVAEAADPGLKDTSYVCVIDAAGNVFSATPSDTACDAPVVPGTGICPSSRGSQSRADPHHPAAAAPGKRPRLTPNPAIALKDGRPFLAFGTPGGDVQVQAMAQFLINVLTFDMDVQCAIEAPRFASYSFASSFSPFTAYPGLLAMEARIPDAVAGGLEARGHRIERWPEFTRKAGAICAIRVDHDTGLLHAGADPRRAAYALGC